MVTVSIDGTELPLEQVTADWINQLVNRKFRTGAPVCVRVAIKTPKANVILATPACPTSGGSTRAPNPDEARILAFWEQRGLRREHFEGGEVVAFLKQLGQFL